jgi:tryptophanyl-tRNA synthetase
MTNQERQEIEDMIVYLKFILNFHNQQAEKGNFMYGMTEAESLEHRLDAMEEIANLERKLKENAVHFAALTSPKAKMLFLQTQLSQLADLQPQQQLEHLQAIKNVAQELSKKLDKKNELEALVV